NGDIGVVAQNAIGMQNLALSGGASRGGAAVGGAIVVNVFPDITTTAFIDSNTSNHITQVDALGETKVSAKSSIKEAPGTPVPIIGTLPAFSSAAVAGAASSGGAAVSGSVIVDVFTINTNASIGQGTRVNQHPERLASTATSTQTLKVLAQDDTS